MRRFQLTTVLLVGTLAMFLTGCSRNPASPDLSTPTQGGAAPMSVTTDEAPDDVQGGTPAQVTQAFLSAEEGRLTVGRWTLDLHKNSLRMPATVTMRVSSEDAMEVEIEVVPAEAADMQVPAYLWANMSDQPTTDYSGTTMFEWVGDAWLEMTDCTPHPREQNLMAKRSRLGNSMVGDKLNAAETAESR
jgi:hypothetical protein